MALRQVSDARGMKADNSRKLMSHTDKEHVKQISPTQKPKTALSLPLVLDVSIHIHTDLSSPLLTASQDKIPKKDSTFQTLVLVRRGRDT